MVSKSEIKLDKVKLDAFMHEAFPQVAHEYAI